ncbi:MAG: PAS domain S-box protein [Burkholderiales bacterium]|nr:PAS domain S-box protein [Burkholderiales bacterium]
MTGADHDRRLEMVVRNTTNMVVITNRRREIVWVNAAYTRVTGWSLEEVRGRNPRSFLHGPRTNLSAATRLGAMLRRGESVVDFEMLNYKKSGELYWVSLNIEPIVGEGGEVTEYIAIQSDITERKRAEQAAARVRHRLQQAQQMARLGSVEHDLASGQVLCSAEMLRLVGCTGEDRQIDYEAMWQPVHPDELVALRERYEAAINAGAPLDVELRLTGADGAVRWAHALGALEGWDDGRPALYRLVVQDITERKLVEQAERDRQLLEQAARTQVEVLSRVSHELRTPLHAVLGFAEMLERHEAAHLAERSRAQLAHIRDSARHLLLIVNDILELTRLRGRRDALSLVPVALCPVVKEAVAMLEPLAAAREVSVQVSPGVSGPWVQADRQRLLQVVINLLGNAIKYNRHGGRVVLGCDTDASQQVLLSVADTGPGIAPQAQARLFEPFFRAEALAPGARRDDSSGLGLAIARAMAEAMGGDISVDSAPGHGSTFTLRLQGAPSAPMPAHGAAPAAPAADAGVHGHVLYIEDNEVNCLLIEGYLRDRPGITLTCCSTGAEGLMQARRLRPSLILIDTHLPDLDGNELVRQLMADPDLYRTPCVAFSADQDLRAVERAIRAGFREYLHKPVASAEFLALVDRLLVPAAAPRH